MAMASGLFCAVWVDILDGTQLAVDLTSTSNVVCLFDNTFDTADFDSAATHAALNGELSTGSGYTQHNKTVGGAPTITAAAPATGQIKYTWSAAVEWTSSSITAYGMVVSKVSTTEPIVAVSFGSSYQSTNGTFSVSAHSNGIFYIDLVP